MNNSEEMFLKNSDIVFNVNVEKNDKQRIKTKFMFFNKKNFQNIVHVYKFGTVWK